MKKYVLSVSFVLSVLFSSFSFASGLNQPWWPPFTGLGTGQHTTNWLDRYNTALACIITNPGGIFADASLPHTLVDNSSTNAFATKATIISAGDGLYGGGRLDGNITLILRSYGVTATHLASNSVINTKLADSSVSTGKLDATLWNRIRSAPAYSTNSGYSVVASTSSNALTLSGLTSDQITNEAVVEAISKASLADTINVTSIYPYAGSVLRVFGVGSLKHIPTAYTNHGEYWANGEYYVTNESSTFVVYSNTLPLCTIALYETKPTWYDQQDYETVLATNAYYTTLYTNVSSASILRTVGKGSVVNGGAHAAIGQSGLATAQYAQVWGYGGLVYDMYPYSLYPITWSFTTGEWRYALDFQYRVHTNLVASGLGAMAVGRIGEASGVMSLSINGLASGPYSMAIGAPYAPGACGWYGGIYTGFMGIPCATGLASIAIGPGAFAPGALSFAAGPLSSASAERSYAFGGNANNMGSVAFPDCAANGSFSFAAAFGAEANGDNSAAFSFSKANSYKSFSASDAIVSGSNAVGFSGATVNANYAAAFNQTVNTTAYTTSVGEPRQGNNAATKNYVDGATNGTVAAASTATKADNASGLGDLISETTIASRLAGATNAALLKSGGTMSGILNMGGQIIANFSSLKFLSGLDRIEGGAGTMDLLTGNVLGLRMNSTTMTYYRSPNMNGNHISNAASVQVGVGLLQVGHTVYSTNGTVETWCIAGSTISPGMTLCVSRDIPLQVIAAPAGAYDPIGTAVSSAVSGGWLRIAASGPLVQKLIDKQPALAEVAYTSDTKSGYITSTNSFPSNPTDQTHFRECGHVTSLTNSQGQAWVWQHHL